MNTKPARFLLTCAAYATILYALCGGLGGFFLAAHTVNAVSIDTFGVASYGRHHPFAVAGIGIMLASVFTAAIVGAVLGYIHLRIELIEHQDAASIEKVSTAS